MKVHKKKVKKEKKRKEMPLKYKKDISKLITSALIRSGEETSQVQEELFKISNPPLSLIVNKIFQELVSSIIIVIYFFG